MLGCSPPQDRCAERGWVDRCVGGEVHSMRIATLQRRMVTEPHVAVRASFVAAPETHALQDLRGRARPS
eukprot:4231303-Alexandrium_andersonii.AAC.1